MKYTLASSGSCSQSTCTGFKACQWDFHLFDCIATWKMTVFSYCARIPNRQRAFILWWNLWIHPWHQNNIVKISEVSLSQGRILCLLSSWDLERCSYFRRWRYGRDARCVRTCQMTFMCADSARLDLSCDSRSTRRSRRRERDCRVDGTGNGQTFEGRQSNQVTGELQPKAVWIPPFLGLDPEVMRPHLSIGDLVSEPCNQAKCGAD